MADPTKKNREAIGSAARAVLPNSSPLSQSLEKSKADAEEALAVDEANNLVMQRQAPALPQEAAAFTQPVIPAQVRMPADSSGDEFHNPSEAQPAMQEVAPQSPTAQAMIVPDQSGQINNVVDGAQSAANKAQQDLDNLAAKREEEMLAHEKQLEQNDKEVEQIEPKGLFHGKQTWQKILGGIGLFLGSITPEGARNVANFIDKEVDRDIESQKTNIKLRRDKEDKRYQQLLQRYGSKEAAMIAKKRDIYTAMELQVKKLEANARNAETRERLSMGREELELKKTALGIQLANAQQKQNDTTVPGYSGNIKDPVAAREFKKAVAEAPLVKREINNLLEINKKFLGGALSSDARASASQSQKLLIGKMREALVGPGSMSEGDRSLMEEAIANPTSFFSLGSSNKIKLEKLMDIYNSKLEADAMAHGLMKNTVPVSGKIK